MQKLIQPLHLDLQERARQEIMYHCIPEESIPVKIFVAGPACCGKTTFLKSALQYIQSPARLFHMAKKPTVNPRNVRLPEKIPICLEGCTMAATVYLEEIEDKQYLNIFDLGGDHCFSAAHEILLNSEESVFFIVYNLDTPKEQITEDIRWQVTRALSHCPLDRTPKIAFVGTHLDDISDFKSKKIEMLTLFSKLKKKFEIEINDGNCIYVNAKKPNRESLSKFRDITQRSASCIKQNMVSYQKCYLHYVSYKITKLECDIE